MSRNLYCGDCVVVLSRRVPTGSMYAKGRTIFAPPAARVKDVIGFATTLTTIPDRNDPPPRTRSHWDD